MGLLVGLFGNTEYVQGLMGEKIVILFICTFVGINAVCEMLSATVITGAVGAALYKARLLPGTEKKSEKVVKQQKFKKIENSQIVSEKVR